jgi:hypothetical protein
VQGTTISGSGVILDGEFDPGSGGTLAACLMHASRTGARSGVPTVADGCVTRGGTCPGTGDNPGKLGLIPHTLGWRWVGQGKAQATVLCSEGPAAYQLDGRVTAYRGDDG